MNIKPFAGSSGGWLGGKSVIWHSRLQTVNVPGGSTWCSVPHDPDDPGATYIGNWASGPSPLLDVISGPSFRVCCNAWVMASAYVTIDSTVANAELNLQITSWQPPSYGAPEIVAKAAFNRGMATLNWALECFHSDLLEFGVTSNSAVSASGNVGVFLVGLDE